MTDPTVGVKVDNLLHPGSAYGRCNRRSLHSFIQDYSPHRVDDPAMLMLVLSVITSLFALITFLHVKPQEEVVEVLAREESRLQWIKVHQKQSAFRPLK